MNQEVKTINGYSIKDEKAVRTYDTVALMKSDRKLKEGQHVKTRGYYSINDGGSAEYYITDTQSQSDYQENLENGLYANLIFENVMNTAQFGCGTLSNQTNFENAIKYCSENNKKLIIVNDINITTLKDTFFKIDYPLEIEGNYHELNVNIIGDYNYLFLANEKRLILRNLIINNNPENEPTENTGVDNGNDERRADIYLKHAHDSIIENVTINNPTGVWQIICSKANNCLIKNNTINFNYNGYDLNYDHTCVYLYGDNIKCVNNILNGSQSARTGIETSGNNILVDNNYIKNYRSSIYINSVNDADIDNVYVINNYCNNKRGIEIYSVYNTNIKNIYIKNNVISLTDDYYALYLFDRIGNTVIDNIFVEDNVFEQTVNSTKTLLRFSPTHQEIENGVATINNLLLKNNVMKSKSSSPLFDLQNNITDYYVNNLVISENTVYCNSRYFTRFSPVNGQLKLCIIENNIFNGNTDYICSINVTTANGSKLIYKNNYTENDVINVLAGNGRNLVGYIFGQVSMDIKTNAIYCLFCDITDKNGNKAHTTPRGHNLIIYNNEILLGDIFKVGDKIINTNISTNGPSGWVYAGNGYWLELSTLTYNP